MTEKQSSEEFDLEDAKTDPAPGPTVGEVVDLQAAADGSVTNDMGEPPIGRYAREHSSGMRGPLLGRHGLYTAGEDEVCAALVVGENADGTVNLMVFPNGPTPFFRKGVHEGYEVGSFSLV